MFAYCNNNPANSVDPSGKMASIYDPDFQATAALGEWLADVFYTNENEVGKDGKPTFNAKVKHFFKTVWSCVELSGGIGMGLYGETNVFDLVGVSGGLYYNVESFHLSNGEFSHGPEMNVGASGSFYGHNFGFEEYQYQFDGEPETNSWFYTNDTMTIFSFAAYAPIGFSFQFGFDIVKFCQEYPVF